MITKENTNIEKDVIVLANRIRKSLLEEKSVDEVVIPCTCVPLAKKLKEYITYWAIGEDRPNNPYEYNVQLITDSISLDNPFNKDENKYNLIVRRAN